MSTSFFFEQLFLAKCGHTACSRCWSQWLNKSPTCPTCRKAVDKTQLEQVVFQEKSGAGVPTLSQLCPREDRNSESSDDNEELEVVKG
jgi:predicted amidophosphoribosyltransferase